MIIDNAILLASAEATTGWNAGATALGETSVNLGLDTAFVIGDRTANSTLGPSEMELGVTINTSFASGGASVNPTISLEFQLVSLPIALSLLADGSGGATGGKVTSIASVAVTAAAPGIFTITGHGLPLGTPIHLTSIATVTGISTGTIYYVVPQSANTFAVATSLANALAASPTLVTTATGAGTCTVNFLPFIHMTTGAIPLPALGAGSRFLGRTIPYAFGPSGDQRLGTGQSAKQPIGAVPAPAGTTFYVPQPGRYLALRYVASSTMSAGAATVIMGTNLANALHYHATGFDVR